MIDTAGCIRAAQKHACWERRRHNYRRASPCSSSKARPATCDDEDEEGKSCRCSFGGLGRRLFFVGGVCSSHVVVRSTRAAAAAASPLQEEEAFEPLLSWCIKWEVRGTAAAAAVNSRSGGVGACSVMSGTPGGSRSAGRQGGYARGIRTYSMRI